MARCFSEVRLVIASHNAGKVREISELLAPWNIEILSAAELNLAEPEETGDSFVANAKLKSDAAALAAKLPSLADDSGLSVDALDGAPGVHSARYAPTDPERIARLLKALNGSDQRQAYFCAALCVAAPDGTILLEVEGRCDGLITAAPRGDQGFGYDPIFEVAGTGRTFAEMPLAEKKQQIGRAHV